MFEEFGTHEQAYNAAGINARIAQYAGRTMAGAMSIYTLEQAIHHGNVVNGGSITGAALVGISLLVSERMSQSFRDAQSAIMYDELLQPEEQ